VDDLGRYEEKPSQKGFCTQNLVLFQELCMARPGKIIHDPNCWEQVVRWRKCFAKLFLMLCIQ